MAKYRNVPVQCSQWSCSVFIAELCSCLRKPGKCLRLVKLPNSERLCEAVWGLINKENVPTKLFLLGLAAVTQKPVNTHQLTAYTETGESQNKQQPITRRDGGRGGWWGFLLVGQIENISTRSDQDKIQRSKPSSRFRCSWRQLFSATAQGTHVSKIWISDFISEQNKTSDAAMRIKTLFLLTKLLQAKASKTNNLNDNVLLTDLMS